MTWSDCLVLICILACGYASDEAKKLDNIPDIPHSAAPPESSGKARLLIYDYDLHAVTYVHDPALPENSSLSTEIRAKYIFEILQHDRDGCILIRYQISECYEGPCENVPDFYVYIVTGGQNVLGVFTTKEGDVDWGITSAIAYAITNPARGGDGDEQNVNTPFGRCHQFFGKPEDKIFQRKWTNCEFMAQRNHTLFPGLITREYEQFIEYRQNKKIDADIVFVDADEQFILQSPIDANLSLRVHSHLSLEMMNRTRRFIDRFCSVTLKGNECAQEVFGAKLVGKNWYDVNKNLVKLPILGVSKLSDFLIDNQQELTECGSGSSVNCAQLFKKLTNSVREATDDEIAHALQNAANDDVLQILSNAVASVAPTSTWNTAQDVLSSKSASLLNSFYENIAFTTVPVKDALRVLKSWATSESDITLHNTFGYLVHRLCLSSPSNLNSCDKGKEPYFNWLLENKGGFTPIQQATALWHLHFKSVAGYFHHFVCSTHDASLINKALTYFEKLHQALFERKTTNKILNTFRNICPQESTTLQSVIAMNTLVRLSADHQTIGSFILRGETLNPANHDLWDLFYHRVEQQKLHGEFKHANYWNTLRNLRAFKPNYVQRSLNSDSSGFWVKYENLSLPVTVKGALIKDEADSDVLHYSIASHLPILSHTQSGETSHLSKLGLGSLPTSHKGQSIILRDYSQTIRLVGGLSLDLTESAIAFGIGEKSHLRQNLDLSLSATLRHVDQVFGSFTKESRFTTGIVAEVVDDTCPRIAINDINYEHESSEESTAKTSSYKQATKTPGISINLGSHVNAQCSV
uniref:Vitellogenin domain-containing protein n=1 Tax=Panagrellus redivivus TaxID=6233 RepID=A0A7E4W5X4_PANRE